jgi:hypothetical protein
MVPFVPSVYAGAVLLALAVAGTTASRAGRLLAASSALLFWAALGPLAGADALLHEVPVWGAFRYPEKLVGPLTLCIALLAGLGCDRLERERPRRRPAWAALSAAAGCAVLAAAAAWAPGLDALAASDVASAGLAAARTRLAAGLLHAILGLAALAALLVARGPFSLPGRFAMAAAALVAAEATAASPLALHAGLRGLERPGPLAVLAGAGAPVRIATPTEGTAYRIRADLDDADAIREIEALIGVAPYPARHGIDQLNAYSGLVSRSLADVGRAFAEELGPASWIAYRRYGLTHVVVTDAPTEHARAAVAGGRLVYADPGRGISAYEVPRRPWAAFAGAVLPVADRAAALAAVIAAERRGDPAVAIEGGPAPSGGGEVLAIERTPERVRIEATAATPATLIVNDAFWPGWRAILDGAPAAILRADGLVRAIPWPAGGRSLELRYDPPEVRAGALASGVGVVLVLVLAAAGGIRARAAPLPDGDDSVR